MLSNWKIGAIFDRLNEVVINMKEQRVREIASDIGMPICILFQPVILRLLGCQHQHDWLFALIWLALTLIIQVLIRLIVSYYYKQRR